jgi:hypothetical protein
MGKKDNAESDLPPPPPVPWSDQKSYDFDTWYCSEPTAQYQVLFWVNVVCVIILMVLFTITGSLADMSGFEFWAEMIWMSVGQLFDGIGGSPDGGLWGTRFVGLVNTFMGMFVFGLVCAFIEDAINSKLESLRRGKTKVLEDGFNLIIGWNGRILPLVQQLILANESNGGGVIVILSDMDKPEMDDFWQSEIPIEERMGTKIVTRQGEAIEAGQLRKVSAKLAKSIVVLAPSPHEADESDAQVIRIMLALTGKLGTPGVTGIRGHVVAELCDIDNLEYAKLATPHHESYTTEDGETLTGKEIQDRYVKTVVGHDLTGRLMIQCALQPGLARVFSHILAFEYNEFYFKCFPELQRRRFADVCFMFEDAVPFGIHFKEPQLQMVGDVEVPIKICINPAGDTVLDAEDEIIVIAEDDDSFKIGELQMVDPRDCPDFAEEEPVPVRWLLIGFRRDLDDMINEVDKWVAKGSTLTMMSTHDVDSRIEILKGGGLKQEMLEMNHPNANCSLKFERGNPVLLKDLQMLENPSVPEFDAIIVLTESTDADNNPLIPLNCDSRTLVTTLLIRDIQKKEQTVNTMCCEILDPRTEKLLALSSLDDYISVNDMVSMALGQIAEESDIHGLLIDIFSPEGSEMHIKDIRLYANEGETLNWWEIVARARMRGEVALGFIKKELSPVPILNPGNSAQQDVFSGTKQTRITWKYGDQLVVLSED